MSYHRDDLFRTVFLQECVKQSDTSGFSKAAKIGIRMGRTAAAIHHIDTSDRKIDLVCKTLNSSPEFPIFQWCERIEHGCDYMDKEGLNRDHKGSDQSPGDPPAVGTIGIEKVKDWYHNHGAQYNGQAVTF